jgi:hypothetical protein
MKNTAISMVLRGRRVEEWVRGAWVLTNQRAQWRNYRYANTHGRIKRKSFEKKKSKMKSLIWA